MQLQTRQQDALRRLDRWQAAALPRPGVAKAPLRSASGAAQAAQVSRQWRSAAQHPWPWLFGGIESAGDQIGYGVGNGVGNTTGNAGSVRWLALEHERERGDVRLEGVAGSAGLALKLVDALAGQTGWSNVVLLRLAEPERSEAGMAGVRFEISGRFGSSVAAPPLARTSQPQEPAR